MKIVLMRHGNPDVNFSEKIYLGEFAAWVNTYNTVGVTPSSVPSAAAKKIFSSCDSHVCSDFVRSIHSARLLDPSKTIIPDSLFRECEIPYFDVKTKLFKLSPKLLTVFFRVIWLCGFSPSSESKMAASLRAGAAADKLEDLAHEKGAVIFVGHGYINRFIASSLLKRGWTGPRNPGRKYWEFSVYEK